MKKILFLFLLLFFSFFSFCAATSAGSILVENVFSDIDSDYLYRDELQLLYDRGMIFPDESGRFSPDTYLNRDEFVGISMEVICERCIQPHTDFHFLEEFRTKDVYFDIDNSNPYFYCVAEADKQNYVRGYDIGESCENGTNKFGERPFCPLNRINLEEAIAVLLRNSGIFTIGDNGRVVDRIRSGNISESISNDVSPTDDLNNPYTFYGYLQKALSFQITEYDEQGNEKIWKLLELDSEGNINPKKSITKQEFLKMAYIVLKSNSCADVTDDNLALAIDIWEKSCQPGDTNCEISALNDSEDTYDFTPDVEGYCELGIDDPTGYAWRFYNITNGAEFFHYGTFLDNILLPSAGEWRVYLTVKDKCGNSGEVYSTIVVESDSDQPPVDQEIDVDIDVFDDNCTGSNTGCLEIEFENEEDDGDDIFDFDGDVSTSCQVGNISYAWIFTREGGSERFTFNTQFVDNFDFLTVGVWNILLEVEDGCGQTGSEQMTYIVYPEQEIDVDIDVFDDNCTGSDAGCREIEFEDEEDDGDDIFDFDGDVSTTCQIGEISYAWTFTREGGNERFTFNTQFVDNFDFLTPGVWNILLEVEDGCGQTGSEQMTYVVYPEGENYIDVDIDVFDDNCTGSDAGCPEIEFENEEDDGDDIFDFDGDVSTSCQVGSISYAWTFTREGGSERFTFNTEFVDNFDFLTTGVWNILLEVEDGCNQTGSEQMTYIVYPDLGIDVDIDVFDDNCTGSNTGCPEIEFENEEDDGDDIFDFDGDVSTNCLLGEISYIWTFKRIEGSERFTFNTQFVDNFDFLTAGVWNILLEVEDGCGQTGSEQMTYIVYPTNSSALNVDILADPIIGVKDLLVDFQGVVYGGTAPFDYQWDFGDTNQAVGKNVEHLFVSKGVFQVTLIVTDSDNVTGSATVLIKVLDGDACLQDSDGDGIADCKDYCPLVEGSEKNNGCPIFETSCTETCGCEDGYTCSDSDPLTCGAGVCVPVEVASSCLYAPSVGAIFGNTTCNTCPCSSGVDFLADIRNCDLVFPAITSPDGTEIYSKGRTWQVK